VSTHRSDQLKPGDQKGKIMQAQPYLFFNGRCEEAAKFYCQALGAELTGMMRFSEMPESGAGDVTPDSGHVVPDSGHKIMHMSLQVGDTTIMASDGMGDDGPKFEGFSLALTTSGEAEAKRVFDQLADGGQIKMPLAPTFWSPCFGIVADKFGVSWMVMVAQ
jgi:PhnB protein